MANEIVNKIKNELTFEKVLMTAMKTPGVKINRAKFLRKELRKYCREAQVEKAIKESPAKAGISKDIINKVSQQVINYESTKVTGLSIAASIPGGAAAAGAAVTHVDASKGMVGWAKENAVVSGLADRPIRWLVDDCGKFVEREIRRGNRYDAIIMLFIRTVQTYHPESVKIILLINRIKLI